MRRDHAKAIDAAVFELKCQDMARRHLEILGVADNWPLPRFAIAKGLGARWSGRCTWAPSFTTCAIQVHQRMTASDRSIERVVAHEVIHHVVFMRHGRLGKLINHGKIFLDMLRQLNAVLGEDFVTVRCGDDYERAALPRPIKLVLWRRPGAAIPSISWHSRATARTERLVAALLRGSGEVRLAETTDGRWTQFPKTGRHLASPSRTEEQTIALQLWDTGVPMTLTPGIV
jgi:hypothetical protein